jgi:hypothetical protein
MSDQDPAGTPSEARRKPKTPTQQLEELLRTLIEGTLAEKLVWRSVGEKETQFVLDAADGAQIAIDSRDDDGHPPFDLYVFNDKNEITDELRGALAPRGLNLPENVRERNKNLRTLFELARRQATGADAVLKSVIDDVRKRIG